MQRLYTHHVFNPFCNACKIFILDKMRCNYFSLSLQLMHVHLLTIKKKTLLLHNSNLVALKPVIDSRDCVISSALLLHAHISVVDLKLCVRERIVLRLCVCCYYYY